MRTNETFNKITSAFMSSLTFSLILSFGFSAGYAISIGLLEVFSPYAKLLSNHGSNELLLPFAYGTILLSTGAIGCISTVSRIYAALKSLPRGVKGPMILKEKAFSFLSLSIFTGMIGFAVIYFLILISTLRLF